MNAIARIVWIAITMFCTSVVHAQSVSTTGQETVTTAVGTSLPAVLPLRRDEPDVWSNGGASMGLALGCLGLFALLIYVRKKLGASGEKRSAASSMWRMPWGESSKGNRLSIVEKLQLSTECRVQVVEWNGNRYLIAHNANTITLIDRSEVEKERVDLPDVQGVQK